LPRGSATLMASRCGRSCDATWVMGSGRFAERIDLWIAWPGNPIRPELSISVIHAKEARMWNAV
jgi:hypothetical protein